MGKTTSLTVLVLAEIACMSLWFTSSAILADVGQEIVLSEAVKACLATAVQIGFVIGALCVAITGLSDRMDPRHLFALSALIATLTSLALLWVPMNSVYAILMRLLTGVSFAGLYPVGMRLAMSWGERDRGFLVGLLVGALTLGSALPHLVAFTGGSDWRLTIWATSGAAFLGGMAVLLTGLGPNITRAGSFKPQALMMVWHDARLRGAYLGYFGHMWELYVMWAWLGVALTEGFAHHMPASHAADWSKLAVFAAVAAGALSCIIGGRLADRFGKADLTIWSMVLSGLFALATAYALWVAAPIWLLVVLSIGWGITIIPDSPQFSAIVADVAPADLTGSLLTLQTALGFLLTCLTVQAAPFLAASIGWPATFAILALGPLLGVFVMVGVRRNLLP